MNKLLNTWWLVLCVNTVLAQTEIVRESFTTTANLTTSKSAGFCGSDNSGACGSANILDVDVCTSWSGFGGSGDQSFLFAQDYDDCGGTGVGLVENVVVDLGTVAGGNTGNIVFYGLFGSRGSGSAVNYDVSDSAIVEISVNGGGAYTKYLKIDRFSGDQLQISNYGGGNTETLSLTYTERSISLGSGLNGQQILVRITFYNLTGSEAIAVDEFVLTHCGIGSSESTVEENGFDEPDNIAYSTYSAASGLTTVNAIKVGELVINDGGSDNTDGDALPTILSSISFSVLNPNNVEAVALFDGASNLAEETDVVDNIAFSNLTITAADEGSKSFDIYATFKSFVVDNEQIQFTVTSVTAASCNSSFAAADGGGASTSVAGDDNRIEVTATKLVITGDDWADINTNFNLTVKATDANNNIDKDNTTSVTLSEDGAGIMSSGAGLTQSLVAGIYSWTDLQHDTEESFTITASDGSLTDGTHPFATNNPSIYYLNDGTMDGDELWCTAVGNDANTGGTADPYRTLGQALSVVANGDIIYVDVGTYNQANDKDLTLANTKVRIIGAGDDKTIFDNPGADNYFLKVTGNDTYLQGFKVFSYNETGTATAKALDINGATGVIVNNVQMDANDESGGDYAVKVYGAAEVTFGAGGSTCNDGSGSGGMEVSGTATVNLNNYSFIGNSRNDHGPSLRVEGGTVNMRKCLVSNTVLNSDRAGAAIYCTGGTVNVYDCIFEDNQYTLGTNIVGGVVRVAGGTVNITRSKILNMTSASGSDAYGAAGITSGTLNIDSTTFEGNNCGGSCNESNDVYVNGGTATVFNCTFNSAADNVGADAGTLTISNSGNPSEAGSGATFTNTIAPSYTANPIGGPGFMGTCGTSITLLPIELKSFTGSCFDDKVLLKWETESEKNNDYFIVQRSVNLRNFEDVARIEGSGNSNVLKTYNYWGENKHESTVYFRLKQVDFDGTISYSDVLKVWSCSVGRVEDNSNLSIFPNPLNRGKSQLLNFSTEVDQIRVYNAYGVVVMSVSGNNIKYINLNNSLVTGMYYVVALDEYGVVKSLPLQVVE